MFAVQIHSGSDIDRAFIREGYATGATETKRQKTFLSGKLIPRDLHSIHVSQKKSGENIYQLRNTMDFLSSDVRCRSIARFSEHLTKIGK